MVRVNSWFSGLMPARRGWRLGLGITMVVLGLLALGSMPVAGVLSVGLLGLALMLGGIMALIAIFGSEGLAETLVMLLLAAMLLITGIALFSDPVHWLVTIGTLIATYLFLSGMARIVIALFNRQGRWGLGLLHGVINLLLSIFIWSGWPVSGLLAVGFVVGIELILIGVRWIIGAPAKPPQPSAHGTRATRHRQSGHKSRRK
jgi:uncharacterized membrane protein HdeD (DUF308 family)